MSFRSLRRSTATALATAAAMAALTACGGGASTGSTTAGCADGKVGIGVLLPLSGSAAGFGQGIRQAMEYAASEVNSAGGLTMGDAKCTVELVDFDTKGSAEQASTGINTLISKGQKIIWGPNLSHEVTAVQPIAQRNGALIMQASYSSKGISPQQPLNFAMVTTPSGFANPMAKWVAAAYLDARTALIVVPDNEGGRDTATIDTKAYAGAGITATTTTYAPGTTDFAPFIGNLLRNPPDLVDLASTPPGDSGVIIKQLRQAGYDGPIGRIGGEATSAIIDAVGSPAGLGDFYYYAAIDSEARPVQDYFAAFAARFGNPPLTVSAQALPAARMLLHAIDETDSTDPAVVAAALEKLPVDDPTVGKGVWGGKDFYGINHEIVLDFFAGRYQDGQRTLTPLSVTGL